MAVPRLFERLAGPGYPSLPATVRAFHEAALPACFRGRAQVRAATGRLARLAARLARLPLIDGEVPVQVMVSGDETGEHWQREFDGVAMNSVLRQGEGDLIERLGALQFRFRLDAGGHGIRWRVVAVRGFGLPLPMAWFGAVRAHEFERDGRYCFEIDARLPLLGHIIAYTGWLVPAHGDERAWVA